MSNLDIYIITMYSMLGIGYFVGSLLDDAIHRRDLQIITHLLASILWPVALMILVILKLRN